MIGVKKATLSVALLAIFVLFTTTSFADFLGTAYNDGSTTWSGRTYFPDPYPENPEEEDLAGYVDWIVYGPGQFPYTGYTPTSGGLTYVYQIQSVGYAAVTFYGVSLENSADNIGAFSYTDTNPDPPDYSITGDAPNDMSLDLEDGGAVWYFDGIAQGTHSQALVYSSLNTPQNFWSLAINHGSEEYIIPVPSPSSNPIPEPATIWTLLIGLGLIMATRKLKQS